MRKKLIIIFALLPLLAIGQCRKTVPPVQQKQVRNVIFIVGDGMGTAQVYTSVVAQKGDNSAFLRFPYTGFSRTTNTPPTQVLAVPRL